MSARRWAYRLYILAFGALLIRSLLAAEWGVAIVSLILLAPVLVHEFRKGYRVAEAAGEAVPAESELTNEQATKD